MILSIKRNDQGNFRGSWATDRSKNKGIEQVDP
jgi:hypothetical protein